MATLSASSRATQVLPAHYRKKPTWKRRTADNCFLRVFKGNFDPISACVDVDDRAAADALLQRGFGSSRPSEVESSLEESSSCENTRASDVVEQSHSPAFECECPENDHIPEAKRFKHSNKDNVARCLRQHTYCLSLVEAFYLSHAMRALSVHSPSGHHTMDHLELWRAFLAVDSTHPVRYAAYHHLRTHGWVPRCGLKFGVEYLAYREGVGQYHSSYCVKVRDVSKACGMDAGPGWLEVTALQRVAEGAGKNLVVMDVVVPSNATMDNPECVQQFAIQETLVRRWNYTRDRTTAGSDVD